MKRILFTLAIAAAALCACNKAEGPMAPDTSNPVRFTVANLGSYAFKSPTLGIGEIGCSNVGIYAADLGANNVQATVSGTTLTPATTIYWGVGQTTASTFIARYPYAADAPVSGEYAIPIDQSAADTYTYQANLMTAVKSASPDPGTVAFDFKHPFAKIVVSITNNLEADAVVSVVMKKVKMNASVFNMETAPASVTLADTKSDVTAYAVSATQYEMIIMPQAATNEMDIVVTTTLGSVYTFRITGDYTFQAGKTATATVTLDPIGGASFVRTAVGAMSFTTADWENGSNTTVGTIGDPTIGNYYQIGGTIFSDDDKNQGGEPTVEAWTKWYNMTYSAANTWTAVINYKEAMEANDANKGFLIRLGNVYYKMYKDSENIGTNPYQLYPEDGDHNKNVRLPEATGKFTITYNSSTREVSFAAAQ